MRRWVLTALVASSLMGGSTAISTGCGGSDNGGGGDTADGSTDTSTPNDAAKDNSIPPNDANQGDSAPPPDDANTGDTHPPPPPPFDAGVPPTGTKIISGLYELPSQNPITSDGYVVYLDDGDKNMKIASLAGDGGAPVVVGAFNANNFISVVGSTVLMWPSPAAKPPLGTMYTWTAAKGVTLIDNSTIAGAGGLSADGTKVTYVSATGTAKVGDVSVANVDGTGKQVLQANIATLSNTKQPGCGATLAFAGGKSDKVALAWCTPTGTTQTISMYQGAGNVKTDVATNVAPNSFASFVSDAAGSKLLTVILGADGGAPTINLVATANGAKTPVEGGDLVAFFNTAGNTAYYIAGSSFRSTPTGAVAPKNLATVPANGIGIYPTLLPPDQSHVLLFSQQDNTTNATDLVMVDTTTANQTVKTLQANPTASLFGDVWTADSTRVMYVDGTQLIGNGLVGTLQVAPVATGVPVKIADLVWLEWALTGSKITYADNSVNVSGAYFRADLEVLDFATGGVTPKKLVKAADANYYPTPDKTRLVYTYQADPTPSSPLNGLWTAAIP